MIVKVDGVRIPWFTSFEAITSIANIADVFTFTTRLNDVLLVNKEVQVLLHDNIPLFNGYIDRMTPTGNGMGKWQVRSTMSALIDSCPIVSTGEFKNLTTRAIIAELARPFGINVIGEDGIIMDKYNVELDTPCYVAIVELCVYAGLIAHTHNSGDSILALTDYAQATTPIVTLVEGLNCNFIFGVDSRNTASEYVMLGQDTFLNGTPSIHQTALGVFPGIKRHCNISDVRSNATNSKAQVEWVQRGMDASAESLTAIIPGISTILKGDYIQVNAPSIKIEQAVRLVEQVKYVLKNEREQTELTLVPSFKYGGEYTNLSGWLL